MTLDLVRKRMRPGSRVRFYQDRYGRQFIKIERCGVIRKTWRDVKTVLARWAKASQRLSTSLPTAKIYLSDEDVVALKRKLHRRRRAG